MKERERVKHIEGEGGSELERDVCCAGHVWGTWQGR